MVLTKYYGMAAWQEFLRPQQPQDADSNHASTFPLDDSMFSATGGLSTPRRETPLWRVYRYGKSHKEGQISRFRCMVAYSIYDASAHALDLWLHGRHIILASMLGIYLRLLNDTFIHSLSAIFDPCAYPWDLYVRVARVSHVQ